MKFVRYFRFQVIIRILLICLGIGLLVYLITETNLYAFYLIFGVVFTYQIIELILYVEKSNRKLLSFLEAVKYADFSQSFSEKYTGPTFKELNETISDIFKDFQKYRTEKEEQYRYLQTVVKHVGIGLLVFLPDGTVDMINMAAKRLFDTPGLKNIKALQAFSSELVKVLFELNAGEKSLVRVDNGSETLQLAVYATEFRMRGDIYKLVSLQNIRSELEEQEMEAWQKMIRILTHEIMNSITPISSLTETVRELLDGIKNDTAASKSETFSPDTIDDMHNALKTIQKRSLGLQHFVGAYRNLTLIPKPQFKIFSIRELFGRIEQLMETRLTGEGIDFSHIVEPISLELTADPELIEQVLINLLLNAIDAVKGKENPRIEMRANMDERGYPRIAIIDNGTGMVKEAREKLFVPFFTTKKKGSGIGLSLSRQIMRLHGGGIAVETEPDEGSVFTLRF
jgi:two-component system nitrogen regulation sensor histidine kinase NtrY